MGGFENHANSGLGVGLENEGKIYLINYVFKKQEIVQDKFCVRSWLNTKTWFHY